MRLSRILAMADLGQAQGGPETGSILPGLSGRAPVGHARQRHCTNIRNAILFRESREERSGCRQTVRRESENEPVPGRFFLEVNIS